MGRGSLCEGGFKPAFRILWGPSELRVQGDPRPGEEGPGRDEALLPLISTGVGMATCQVSAGLFGGILRLCQASCILL